MVSKRTIRSLILVVCLGFSAIVLIVSHAEAQPIVIHSPVITNLVNTPQNPPPGYSVNVTATVNSYPRAIAQVRLIYFTSSSRMNRTTQMVLVNGNSTSGLFYAQIPSNVSVNRVTVTYFVEATDSSGFERVSEPKTYLVQTDNTPPIFSAEYGASGYLDTPILNFTKVEVKFNVTDSGSGVRSVFVEYSNSSDLSHRPTQEVNLTLAGGDRFDGFWSGFIPPMSNGTVLYRAEAVDFAGNEADSSQAYGPQSYQISLPSAFRVSADVDIFVQNLNLSSRKLTVDYSFSIQVPSSYVPSSFYSNIETRMPSYNETNLSIPRIQDTFHYQASHVSEIQIYDINLWPYDSYLLNSTITLSAPFNENNTHVHIYVGGPVGAQFDSYILLNETQATPYGENIFVTIQMNRSASAVDIMQAIYAVFLVLGSAAWIKPSKLSIRLELFVGLFTFVVVLFFTLTQILPSEGISEFVGLTVPQALLVGLIWSITLFASASFIVGYMKNTGELPTIIATHKSMMRHVFNFSLAITALIVTWYFGKIFVGHSAPGVTQYEYFLFEKPDIYVNVIAALFGPSIIAVWLDAAIHASKRKMMRRAALLIAT